MNNYDSNERVTSKHRFQLLNKSIGINDNRRLYNDKEIDEFVCVSTLEELGAGRDFIFIILVEIKSI